MTTRGRLQGNFLYWVTVPVPRREGGKIDVAVYIDKEAIQRLAHKAVTSVSKMAKSGPVMCHVWKGPRPKGPQPLDF